jgi:hypothetical protein
MAMSKEHKEALAEGRRQSRAIKAYLKAIQSRKPGRTATKQSIEGRLNRIDAQMVGNQDPLKRVDLLQAKLELQDQLSRMDGGVDMGEVEKGFVAHAKAYSERKGLSYTAWRRAGVPAATLKAAGIKETRRRR